VTALLPASGLDGQQQHRHSGRAGVGGRGKLRLHRQASNGTYSSAATAAASAIPEPKRKSDLTPILMLLLD